MMKNQGVIAEHEAAASAGETATPPTAPVGPLSVQPLQWDHGASIAICHPSRGVIATIEPTNTDDDPDMATAKREPWDISYAYLFAAAPQMHAALAKCNDAFAAWQFGQIPGRPEDILALIMQVRTAIEAATPVADPLIGRWWEPKVGEDDDQEKTSAPTLPRSPSTYSTRN
jgi:hypothetical protein